MNVGKNLGDLQNRIPIAVRGWNSEKLLNLAEITNRFHMSAIQTQDESLSDLYDLQKPVVGRGETEREGNQLGCLRFGI